MNDKKYIENFNHQSYEVRSRNYKNISEEELEYLMRSASLFGRKFKTSCSYSLNKRFYYDIITDNNI